MSYDTAVPFRLKNVQQWFAGVITQPLDCGENIQPIAPSGCEIVNEAKEYLVPSPTLLPWQRIQIYNQQYWWRLLHILQTNFPTVARLFGYQDFNKSIAVPYLMKYPSNNWSVDRIGDRLPQWIRESYHAEDKAIVHDAAQLDFAFYNTFAQADFPPLDLGCMGSQDAMEELLEKKIFLQPWIHLFEFDSDLLSFREELLRHEPDHWVEHDFPILSREKKRYYFVIFRDLNKYVLWNSISQGEFAVLSRFKEGGTIEQACRWLEEQDRALCDEAAARIHFWFQEWTIRNWLTIKLQK